MLKNTILILGSVRYKLIDKFLMLNINVILIMDQIW